MNIVDVLMIIIFFHLSGGYDRDASLTRESIMKFDKETQNFIEVGKMQQRRDIHSMSLVNIDDYTCK